MNEIHYKTFMYTHKIEKAMSMPKRWSVFAQNDVRELLRLCDMQNKDVCLDGVREAYETIQKYLRCLDLSIQENMIFYNEISLFLNGLIIQESVVLKNKKENPFSLMMKNRKSVRNFSNKKVSLKKIKEAIELAHTMPSACNRQPCEFIWIKDPSKRKQLLDIHCGNKGFSAPILGLVVADKKAFFQENEEMAPYYHGGLFSGGLILALESLRLSSCLLNWNVSKEDNKNQWNF